MYIHISKNNRLFCCCFLLDQGSRSIARKATEVPVEAPQPGYCTISPAPSMPGLLRSPRQWILPELSRVLQRYESLNTILTGRYLARHRRKSFCDLFTHQVR